MADRTAGATLRAVDISAGYGARPVIEGVSVIVRPGEIAAIVGPNGSGKSTLLKSLAGVIPVLSGRVLLDERDIRRIWDKNPGAATPDSVAPAVSTTSSRT